MGAHLSCGRRLCTQPWTDEGQSHWIDLQQQFTEPCSGWHHPMEMSFSVSGDRMSQAALAWIGRAPAIMPCGLPADKKGVEFSRLQTYPSCPSHP